MNTASLVDATGAESVNELQVQQDFVDADVYYTTLRDALYRHFENALISGKLIVSEKTKILPNGDNAPLMSYGPVNYSDYHASLPDTTRQHYNCSHCRHVWSQMAGIATMDDDGMVSYPMVEAIEEVAKTVPLAAVFLNTLNNRKAERAQLGPVSSLSHVLLENDVGGWTHFFGVKDKALVRRFNESLTPIFDFKYVQDWFQRFVTNELNTDLLAKIFTFIEAKIGKKEHTALVHGQRLVQLILDTRRVQKTSGRGLLWLWATMQKRENSWMRHINGSVLGIVLDGERECKADPAKMEKVLMNVKSLLASATAGENYKQKTAEASEASFDQAVAFLQERGLTNTMRRRLMRLEEVQSVVWTAADAFSPAAEREAPVPEGYDPVAQAIAGIKVEKNKDLNLAAEMDKVMGRVNVPVTMSASAFLDSLNDYESLRLSHRNVNAVAAFATTAATEGEHEQLLNFDLEVGPHAAILNTPMPITYGDFCQVAHGTREFATVDLPVAAILRSCRISGTEANYLVHIEGFATRFLAGLKHFGTAILGSSIRSEHFGMSRALCELSKRIPMEGVEAEKAVGGAMLRAGMVFEATLKNGTKQTITLSSWK